MKLTIYFDGSFWCGLIELDETGNYQANRYVFGPEPKDSEVFDFVCYQLPLLLQKHNVPLAKQPKTVKKVNPKRMQRLINREKRKPAVSTKAQQAMSEAREVSKTERQSRNKAEKVQLAKEQFELKQAKKRQKKRGH
ncbi:YjdF family protein [Enterococcus sp. AZ109]|uniref:YjdF family protein n=1 Tax=Enterococcus sp. AZ109 TaxID=2774634 RepID=UPI003F286862